MLDSQEMFVQKTKYQPTKLAAFRGRLSVSKGTYICSRSKGANVRPCDTFEEKNKRSKRSSSTSKYQEEEFSDDWTQSHIDKQPSIFQVITQTLLNPTQDPFYTIIVYGVLIIIILIMAIFAVDY